MFFKKKKQLNRQKDIEQAKEILVKAGINLEDVKNGKISGQQLKLLLDAYSRYNKTRSDPL